MGNVRLHFDTRSADDYRRFLAVRRCPIYSFKGAAAVVPEEFAASLGETVKRKRSEKYQPFGPLFDYQQDIAALAIRKQKYAVFADCGLGKTLMLLEFARHAAQQSGGKVLIVSPLMVCRQTIDEASKWYGDNLPIRDPRRFYGCELKTEYHRQALKNLSLAVSQQAAEKQMDLFAELTASPTLIDAGATQ